MIKQIKTIGELLDKIQDLLNNGCVTYGKYEGNDFLIVDSHETLAQVNALINGYDGDLDLAAEYLSHGIDEEIEKVQNELKKAKQENLEKIKPYLIQNRENYLNKLNNLKAYTTWLDANELEDNDFKIETGFTDEYSICCGCSYNIIRTSPDCYAWTPPLVTDEGYICDDCCPDYKDHVLEEYVNVEKSIPDQFCTDDLGLVKINDQSFQNGFHSGMDDSPKPIIEKLNAADIDVWFKVYPSQFYVEFDVYVKKEDKDRAIKLLSEVDTYQGFSNADNCKKALKSGNLQLLNLQGPGIKYAKINIEDGTAETRLVSAEEFIKGIKK